MRSLIIAEDEELFRKELSVSVEWERWGFFLAGCAADGLEALEMVRRFKPDAMLTDIRMPGLDGIQLMEALAAEMEEPERPLVVILSGHSEFEFAQRAVRLGARDYLLKPLDDAELAGTMRRLAAELDSRERRSGPDLRGKALEILGIPEGLSPDAARDPAGAYVERAISMIRYRFVTELRAEDAAAEIGISGGHLSRIFKAKTGLTFSEYLTSYRMKRAAELLLDPLVKVGEVADLVGYADQRYFSMTFHKLMGATPTEFREGKQREAGKKRN